MIHLNIGSNLIEYGIGVKNETGKNTLTYIGDEIKTKKKEADIDKQLRNLVEKRILETRAKLDFSKINQ